MTATDRPDLASVVTARRAVADGSGKALRERARLSLREAADYVGVVPGALCRWESGKAAPSPESAARYAAFLSELRTLLGDPA